MAEMKLIFFQLLALISVSLVGGQYLMPGASNPFLSVHPSKEKSHKNMVVMLIKNQPVIHGFRAESHKYPIVIDEKGLTVIPDKVDITLRLFGNNLLKGLQSNSKIRISFTTTDGMGGEPCDPETQEFVVQRVIDDHMALVRVNLSETIRDKPYQICYAFGKPETKRFLISDDKLNLKQMFQKPIHYHYVSAEDSMKIRVIGRQLTVKYRSKNENRDANLKTKLAQILDEVNQIHKLTDDMQEW